MNNFDYVRPSSVAAASQALLAPGATALSGGHTLIPTMKQRLAKPSMLVDLGGIAELKGIRREGSTLVIGATTTHAEVASSPEVRQAIPALAKLAGGIGDAQVRHRGTMGGSVANNDPAADYPAAVLGLGATIVTNKRQIEADKYFTGLFSTALQPGEIIVRSASRSRSGRVTRSSSSGLRATAWSASSWRRARAACSPRARCAWPSRARATTACSACPRWSRR